MKKFLLVMCLMSMASINYAGVAKKTLTCQGSEPFWVMTVMEKNIKF